MWRKLRWPVIIISIVLFGMIVMPVVVSAATSSSDDLLALVELFKANLAGLKVYYCAQAHTAVC